MRDHLGLSVFWPLILIPSCDLNKNIVFSSAHYWNYSDRPIKTNIVSHKCCHLWVEVSAQMSLTAVTTSKHKCKNLSLFLSPSDILGNVARVLFHSGDEVLLHQVLVRTFWDFWNSPCIAAGPTACHCFVLSVYKFLLVVASTVLTTWCVLFPPLLHADDCREGWVSFF